MSDALAIHISEEYKEKSTKQIWLATFSTFITKLLIASTFVIPVLFLELSTAVIVSILWGMGLIAGFSYYIEKKQKSNPASAISEHLIITTIVILLTYFIGKLINYANTTYLHFG